MLKKTLIPIGALAFATLVQTANGAFIVEPRTPGKATGNYSYVSGAASTTTTDSSAFGLTAGNGSVYGGNGTADEYVFTYSVGTDADNTVITAGLDLGNGNLASGLTGGSTGVYNVYATWPASANITGGGSDFWLVAQGSSTHLFDLADFDQNDPTTFGSNAGANKWMFVGSAELTAGVTYELHVKANSATFVSQRMDGVLFEAAAPVPEPSTIALGLLGGASLLFMGRRRASK